MKDLDKFDYDIEIVAMRKCDLAQMYAADLSPHAAVNRLMRWIEHHPTLLTELYDTGYHKSLRVFSPKQVELIFKYLGEP